MRFCFPGLNADAVKIEPQQDSLAEKEHHQDSEEGNPESSRNQTLSLSHCNKVSTSFLAFIGGGLIILFELNLPFQFYSPMLPT